MFRSPWNEKDYPFEVAAPAQMERYVYALDFVPDGAPTGIGVFDEPETIGTGSYVKPISLEGEE